MPTALAGPGARAGLATAAIPVAPTLGYRGRWRMRDGWVVDGGQRRGGASTDARAPKSEGESLFFRAGSVGPCVLGFGVVV